MKQLAALLILLCLSACGGYSNDNGNSAPQLEVAPPSPDAARITLWSRPGAYDAAVFLPADYGTNPDKKYPLVLSLYGLGGSVLSPDHSEVGGEKSGFIKQVWLTPLSLTYPGVVIAPEVNARNNDENVFWNIRMLVDVIREAQVKYQIDPDKITVTGFSAGSIAAQELALNFKDLMAGIMPGAFDAVIKLNLCSVDDLPIWGFGNTSDGLFQTASWRGVERDIANCSDFTNEFELTVYQNSCGHGCWDDHWSRTEVQEWLVNQSLKKL